jgi:MFS family permease
VTNPDFKIHHLIVPVFIPSVLFATGEASLIPILPTAAENLGASLPVAGLIAGLALIGTVLFDVPAARLVNHFGERKAMIIAGLLAAIALTGALLSTSLLLLGASVLVAGAMASIFGLARHGYMAENVPLNYRARSLSLLGGTFRAGAFLGPIIGAAVVFAWGIHWVYVVGIVFCLASAGVLLVTQPNLMDQPTSTPHVSPWIVARQESAKLATVGMAATILGMMRTLRQVGLPLWGLYIGLHPGKVSLIIGIAGAVDFALFYVSGQIMDRFGRRWAVVPSLLGMAVTHIALVFALSEPSFFWVAVAMSVANATGSGIVLTLGADLAPPAQRNEFLAAYRLLVDTGQAVTPLIISGITLAVSLPAAIVVMSGVSLIGAGLGWKYLPKFGIR